MKCYRIERIDENNSVVLVGEFETLKEARDTVPTLEEGVYNIAHILNAGVVVEPPEPVTRKSVSWGHVSLAGRKPRAPRATKRPRRLKPAEPVAP